MDTPVLGVDHIAVHSYDVGRTHDFYTRVFGATLTAADADFSPEWGRAYLLVGYRLPDGTSLALFTVDGARPPPPKGQEDVSHIALTAGSPAAVDAWKQRLAQAGVAFEIEHHGDGEHLYFRDPNDVMFELTPARKAYETPEAAASAPATLKRWIAGERPVATA